MAAEDPIVDLRGLEPPEPLVRILDEIEKAPRRPMVFLLSREPALLYPLLARSGWRHDVRRDERGYELTVFREGSLP